LHLHSGKKEVTVIGKNGTMGLLGPSERKGSYSADRVPASLGPSGQARAARVHLRERDQKKTNKDQKKTNKDQKKTNRDQKKQNPENMRKHKETITK
jgi:hypothetical protein